MTSACTCHADVSCSLVSRARPGPSRADLGIVLSRVCVCVCVRVRVQGISLKYVRLALSGICLALLTQNLILQGHCTNSVEKRPPSSFSFNPCFLQKPHASKGASNQDRFDHNKGTEIRNFGAQSPLDF